MLDAYAAGGGNFVDTADGYSAWVSGNSGGESETIIGRWLAARGNRDQMVIATKVGSFAEAPGLSRASILKGVDDSLRRLGTDYIDLYYAHKDDPATPIEETVAAFAELVARRGRSGRSPRRTSARPDWPNPSPSPTASSAPRYVALQPHYNLVHRNDFEGELQDLVAAEGLVTVPYYALASGFLTGKYRSGAADSDSSRARGGGPLPRRARTQGVGGARSGRRREVLVGDVGRAGLAGGAAYRHRADRQRQQGVPGCRSAGLGRPCRSPMSNSRRCPSPGLRSDGAGYLSSGRTNGKVSTDRIGVPINIIATRSTPNPRPPVGGMPSSMAPRNSSSISMASSSPAAARSDCSVSRAR